MSESEFDKEMEVLRAESRARIRVKLEKNKEIIQLKLDQFKDDPQNCPPDLVIPLYDTQRMLDTDKSYTQFDAEDKLWVLDQLEAWFTGKKVDFPNPTWLQAQRTRLQSANQGAE